MTTRSTPGDLVPINHWRRLTYLLAAVASCIGGVGLAGWIFDNDILKRVHPSLVTMKANTAIALITSGAALALLVRVPVGIWRRALAALLAVGVACLGLATFAQHLLQVDFGIDQWLFRESVEAAGQSFPGRMGVAASLNFFFVGLALLLIDVKPRGRVSMANALSLAPVVITSLVFLYYFYGIETLAPISRFATIALHTVVAFFALCGGLCFARADRGLMAVLLSSRSGSVMARRVWPAAVFCPILLGWLVVLGQRMEWFGPGFGAALLVALLVLVLSAIIWRTATALDRLDRERIEREHEISESRDTAERAVRAKDNFLAALSHELRTPLNPALLVASDAARNPEIAPEVRALFEAISRNISLEARLIDDLLDLTRITRGKFALDQQAIDPASALRDAITIVQAEVAAKKIDLRLEVASETACVSGDAVRLQQVYWNLLKNAVKFTREHGVVRVTSTIDREANWFRVVIQDDGIGLTPPELERAFDPFAQGDHASGAGAHRFGGLGLGLAISHEIIRLHGGRLTAASEGRDRGATFQIEIPLSSAAATGAPTTRAPAETAAPSPCAGLRILLVEDHAATRQAMLMLLRRRGHAVTSAASGEEARQRARTESFDLVVSDIGLPDVSGFDLMTELRTQHRLQGIALTGYGHEHDVQRSQAAGFLAHLTKPVRIEALEQALTIVLPSREASSHETAREPVARS